MAIRPRRSVLYMPGSNVRALEKAKTLAVDGVIIDLEDSVAPEAKETARKQAADAVKAGGFGGREVFIRINGVDSPWHAPFHRDRTDGFACIFQRIAGAAGSADLADDGENDVLRSHAWRKFSIHGRAHVL